LTVAQAGRSARASSPGAPEHFVVADLPLRLPDALQDLAAAPLREERAVLLGGLDAADTSTATVHLIGARGVLSAATLPEAQHDAQAAALGGRVFLFGGGAVASYSHILSFDPARDSVSQVGSLPTPTSDAAVATIAGTAYVVGGYTGQQALDTVVAWRPGGSARIAGRLPFGLRYAAVAACEGQLVIAGGSRGEAASRTILGYDPATGRVRRLGALPQPLTHAATVTLGRYVYVFGGRESTSGSQTAAILALDPSTGRASGACLNRSPMPRRSWSANGCG